MLVEAFVAEAAVEALGEGVLHRFARRNVVPTETAFLLPPQDGVRGEFAAVVADDEQRLLALCNDGIELAYHPGAGDRGINDQRQALAGEVVDHHEHAEATAIGQHAGDEVEASGWDPAAAPLARAYQGLACGHRDDERSTALPGTAGTIFYG